ASICAAVGLHPKARVVPVAVMTGSVVSSVQLTVRVVVVWLPQPSVAVNVLVCDLAQVPLITPSKEVTVGVLQLSVAVALPSAASICAASWVERESRVGLVAVMTGSVVCSVQVTVRVVVA